MRNLYVPGSENIGNSSVTKESNHAENVQLVRWLGFKPDSDVDFYQLG